MRSLRMMAVAALIAATPAAARAECLAVEFVYQHRDSVLAIKDPTQKSDYIRKAVSSAWAATSDASSKTVMAYGMGEGLATAPSRALADRALSLSHGEMLKLAKGAPVDQQRITKALSKIKNGAAITDDLNIWMDRLGIAVDAINLIDWTIEGMKSGDRYAKAKAAQSAMSIARTVTAKLAGGTMGAMMASVGFLDYAVTSFGDAAHAAYDARWYAAYKEYYDHYNGRDAAFWLNLREKGGNAAVEAELNAFWNDPWSWAEMQGIKTGSLPFAKDALAAATQKRAYASRYMAERIEPMVAAEAKRRAEEAWKQASKDYQQACYAAQAEAETLLAVDAILAGLDKSGLEEQLREALREDDPAKVKSLLAQGADPFKPVKGQGAYDTALAVFMAGMVKPQTVAAFLEAGLKPEQAFKGAPQTVITAAVSKGSAESLRFLAAKGFDVDQPRQDGRTPLMLAAAAGKTDAATILLDAGASVSATDAEGMDALEYAANKGHAETAKLLLGRGADARRVDGRGLTALIIAAARGSLDTVKVLVDAGADPAFKGKVGVAADYAANKGHTQVAEYLRDLAAPKGQEMALKEILFSNTAVIGTHSGASIRLQAKGTVVEPVRWSATVADPSNFSVRSVPLNGPDGKPSQDIRDFDVYAEAERSTMVTVSFRDAAGNYGSWQGTVTGRLAGDMVEDMAIEAVRNQDVATLRRLAADSTYLRDMRLTCVNWDEAAMHCRMSVLGWGMAKAAGHDNTEMIQALLDMGTDPDAPFYTTDGWHKGHTPMTYALAAGSTRAAEMLIQAGADINHANPDGSNALVWAAARNRWDLVRELMDRGADVNARLKFKGMDVTALHLAAFQQDTGMVRALMNNGARITKDERGHTPGYYVYWLTKDVNLAVAAGYGEARDYEAKANDPGFDWAEFARRMQPALQEFGQNMQAIRQQHTARVDQINRNYDRSMARARQPMPPPYAPQSAAPKAAPKAQSAAKSSGRTKWTGGPVCLVQIRLEGTDGSGEHVRETVTAYTAPGCRLEDGRPAPNGPSFSACGRQYVMNGAWAEHRRDRFVQAAASLRGRGAEIEIVPLGSVDQNYGYTYLDRCAP